MVIQQATILEEEVRKALKALSNGKSPGSDGIPIELLKEVDEEAIKVLTAICQQIWIKRIWPKQRWIMERSTEFQRPIYMCFIDYSKAFDCVYHTTLWNMMEEMGVPEHMVQVIRSLYTNQ